MSKPEEALEAGGDEASRPPGRPGDLLLASARQDRQRAEIQAKLATLLHALRPAADGPHALPAPSPVRAGWPRDGCSGETPSTAPAAKPSADVVAPVRAVLAAVTAGTTHAGPVPEVNEMAGKSTGGERIAFRPVVVASSGGRHPEDHDSPAAPAIRSQVGALTSRLDRIEAACVLAATTLDSVVSSMEQTQGDATRAAREEIRRAFAAEVQPALERMKAESSTAQNEIHGVLRLLGTCLERVVGHLHRLEAVTGSSERAPLPAHRPEPQAAAAAEEPVASEGAPEPQRAPAALGPAVPLGGFGRRSRLAALIDFGFGTRAA